MKPFNENNPMTLEENFTEMLHGDVIVRRQKLPKNFSELKQEPNDALAYGEATGHLHKLFRAHPDMISGGAAFDLRIGDGGLKFLKVLEPVCLKHQEHEPRIIPPGDYVIEIQREYDPFTKLARSVAD